MFTFDIKKISIFVCLLAIKQISANILGIDLGSNDFKMNILKPSRPFTMVENQQSRTKTSTGVAYKDDERIYGPDIIVTKSKKPHQSLNFIDKFLGQKFGSSRVSQYIDDHFIAYELVQDDERNER